MAADADPISDVDPDRGSVAAVVVADGSVVEELDDA